jgi:uncharacterized protein YdaU (DUF1376 family)
MSEFPYMPIWVAELMSDRKVMTMSNSEFGMYMRLLFSQWLDGPISPDDAYAITRIEELPMRVHECFEIIDGKFSNKRVQEEWNKIKKKRKEKSSKAKTAAKARWSKDVTSDANALQTHSGRNADAMQTQCKTMPCYNHNQNKDSVSLSACEQKEIKIPPDVEEITMRVFNGVPLGNLSEWYRLYPDDWIRTALAATEASGKTTASYTTGILRNYQKNGGPDADKTDKRGNAKHGKKNAKPSGKFADRD